MAGLIIQHRPFNQFFTPQQKRSLGPPRRVVASVGPAVRFATGNPALPSLGPPSRVRREVASAEEKEIEEFKPTLFMTPSRDADRAEVSSDLDNVGLLTARLSVVDSLWPRLGACQLRRQASAMSLGRRLASCSRRRHIRLSSHRLPRPLFQRLMSHLPPLWTTSSVDSAYCNVKALPRLVDARG